MVSKSCSQSMKFKNRIRKLVIQNAKALIENRNSEPNKTNSNNFTTHIHLPSETHFLFNWQSKFQEKYLEITDYLNRLNQKEKKKSRDELNWSSVEIQHQHQQNFKRALLQPSNMKDSILCSFFLFINHRISDLNPIFIDEFRIFFLYFHVCVYVVFDDGRRWNWEEKENGKGLSIA